MQFSRVNNWLVKEKLDEVITQAHAEKYQLAPRMGCERGDRDHKRGLA